MLQHVMRDGFNILLSMLFQLKNTDWTAMYLHQVSSKKKPLLEDQVSGKAS